MTGQTEAHRLAAWLTEGAWHQMTLGDVEAAGRELRRLQAENEALRKDAERYRWLVSNCGFGIRRNGVHELTIAFHKDMPDNIDDLDAAIDAAKE